MNNCRGIKNGEIYVCSNENYIGWRADIPLEGGCLTDLDPDTAYEYAMSDPTEGLSLIIGKDIVYP